MKTAKINILLIVLVFVCTSSMLFATSDVESYDDTDKTLVTANSADFIDVDTLMDYWFMASYSLILQNKGLGGILAFDPENSEYIAGYRMPNTPEDFFTSIPASTLMSPIIMPTLLARAIFTSLKDADSLARIAYLKDDEAIMLVSVLKVYDNEEIVLEDAAFSLARQAIESSFGASGLNIQPAYDVYARNGITQNDLVEMVLSGEKKPNEISLDAIRMMKAENQSVSPFKEYIPYILVGLSALMTITALLIVIIIMRTKKYK